MLCTSGVAGSLAWSLGQGVLRRAGAHYFVAALRRAGGRAAVPERLSKGTWQQRRFPFWFPRRLGRQPDAGARFREHDVAIGWYGTTRTPTNIARQ